MPPPARVRGKGVYTPLYLREPDDGRSDIGVKSPDFFLGARAVHWTMSNIIEVFNFETSKYSINVDVISLDGSQEPIFDAGFGWAWE